MFSLVAHSQLCDGMFCSLVLFSCDQLKHLKEILKPLIDLSISQHGIPSSLDLFINKTSASSNKKLIANGKIALHVEQSSEHTYRTFNMSLTFNIEHPRSNIQRNNIEPFHLLTHRTFPTLTSRGTIIFCHCVI